MASACNTNKKTSTNSKEPSNSKNCSCGVCKYFHQPLVDTAQPSCCSAHNKTCDDVVALKHVSGGKNNACESLRSEPVPESNCENSLKPIPKCSCGNSREPVQEPICGNSGKPDTKSTCGNARKPVTESISGNTRKPIQESACANSCKPVVDSTCGNARKPIHESVCGNSCKPVVDSTCGNPRKPIQESVCGNSCKPVVESTCVNARKPIQESECGNSCKLIVESTSKNAQKPSGCRGGATIERPSSRRLERPIIDHVEIVIYKCRDHKQAASINSQHCSGNSEQAVNRRDGRVQPTQVLYSHYGPQVNHQTVDIPKSETENSKFSNECPCQHGK